MLEISVENKDDRPYYKKTLTLTNNDNYTISNVDGIDEVEANISTTKIAGLDGSLFNVSYLSEREITISMVINYPVEENRMALYSYFKTKEWCRLHFKTDNKKVFIDGYVKSFSVGYFAKKQTAQIVISCPDPYFKGNTVTVTSKNYGPGNEENILVKFQCETEVPVFPVIKIGDESDRTQTMYNTKVKVVAWGETEHVDKRMYLNLIEPDTNYRYLELTIDNQNKKIKLTGIGIGDLNGLGTLYGKTQWTYFTSGENYVEIQVEDTDGNYIMRDVEITYEPRYVAL